MQMLGLNNVPTAGDEFTVFESEADARSAGVCAPGRGRSGSCMRTAGGACPALRTL